jgi:CheY-like chemotaxis protein
MYFVDRFNNLIRLDAVLVNRDPFALRFFAIPPPQFACIFRSGSMSISPASHSTEDRSALILVVERNPMVQRLERFFLEQAGYSVEFTGDGLTALARAQELRPAILVTEILVPKLDGLSLCRRIKSDASTRDMLVMIFSHLQAEDRALEAGADVFLQKPLNEELLIETLQKLLDLRRRSAGEEG